MIEFGGRERQFRYELVDWKKLHWLHISELYVYEVCLGAHSLFAVH